MVDRSVCFMTARELAALLHAREISAVELLEAHLEQIARVNPLVNAIVTLVPERAQAAAQAADEATARGDTLGPLHGLPIAHKDMALTKGIRTTFGSPIFRDYVPEEDAIIVERLRGAGAITIGKTNTPEFGAGSQTYNEVFGETLNPYDVTKTCGGSSGGAAVALACGMMPIADGSDLGGSLRNPAGFCNVVGLRPSPGRVPSLAPTGWSPLGVTGPMARTVQDVALMLSAIAGPDARSPIAIEEPARRFAAPLDRDFRDVRIAWSRDLGGLPVDPRVTAVIDAQRAAFQALGCEIDDAELDFDGADEAFKVWRAWGIELVRGALLEQHRPAIKQTVIDEIERGRALTGPELGRADVLRTQLYHRVREFMATREFMVLPVSQVPPFPVEERYVTEINGVAMHSYIDWMKSCYYISVVGLPAISVPCGFTPEGLPVGVQIVGRHHDDLGVLQLAHAFEQATGCWRMRPAIAD
jgi:amidase